MTSMMMEDESEASTQFASLRHRAQSPARSGTCRGSIPLQTGRATVKWLDRVGCPRKRVAPIAPRGLGALVGDPGARDRQTMEASGLEPGSTAAEVAADGTPGSTGITLACDVDSGRMAEGEPLGHETTAIRVEGPMP